MQWDRENYRFIFQQGGDPEVFAAYTVSDTAPASDRHKTLIVVHSVANCTATPRLVAFMDASFDDVLVNESATPRVWTPFYKMADWPLEVGKWGLTRTSVRNPRLFGMPGEVDFTWRVEAYEDVQVPAGTFKAFRISVISALPGWSGRRVFWYAPEAQQFVKWEGFFADRFRNWEVVSLDRPALAPLQVAHEQPMDQARITSERIVVAGKVSGGKGVAKVSVTLNGAEVFQQSARLPQRSMAVAETVKLREGMNVIVLSASEPDGTLRQELRTVIYERPKVAEAAPVEPSRLVPTPVMPSRWAVVIGAGNYESPEIPRLRYAVPDAEAMYQILIGPAGFKKEHVQVLTDKPEKRPTLQNIKKALGTFLVRSARKDDTVFIFFAGHGPPEVDPLHNVQSENHEEAESQ
jgi:hypothetical protein